VSASQDEASRHERAFLCFFKDDIASVLDGTSIGLLRHQLLSSLFLHGRRGLALPFLPKCLLSSRSWVMKSTREKERHRRSAFSQARSLPVLFDRSHLGNIFGRWSGSRRMVFCEYWYPLNGTESGKLRGVGRISGVIPLLH
jgi:hypothetical protein